MKVDDVDVGGCFDPLKLKIKNFFLSRFCILNDSQLSSIQNYFSCTFDTKLYLNKHNYFYILIYANTYAFCLGSEYTFHWNELNSIHIIFSICFLLASYEQLRTNFILASLRKNKKGEVVTKSYKIPSGRLFEYVTAPLQLTEIVMYSSLNIILRQSSSFFYIFIWVLANQVNQIMLLLIWSLFPKLFEQLFIST